ncbi:MAG: DNA-protecting protein DprA [Planctomycetes bacterium]|nr:DNA-protecting protein DprA [Planctomycetota bacterium]
MNELDARVALTVARKFTPLALSNLFKRFGSAAGIVGAPKAELSSVPKVNREAPGALVEVIRKGDHLREMETADKAGIRLIMLGEPEYPQLLARIEDPPPLLYARGTLHAYDTLALAVVGGRSASYYGTAQASRFARDFATRRVTVISGLARGIDTAAHRAALEAGGRTIAVVGSGLLDIYPPENDKFALQIAESGAVVSEFPLNTPGVARNFPQRNRLISGMSLGVLVVEATLKSGSLITARLAGEQGREVFALPGKVDSDLSEGPHALIREGAHLVTEPAHVYDELEMLKTLPQEAAPASASKKGPQGLTGTESALWNVLLPSDGLTPDELAGKTNLPVAQVAAGLLTLEMKRLAKQLPGKRFVRLEL